MNETLRLEAKVKAVNRANQYMQKLRAQIIEIFRPFVGQQILKKDGTLLAKIDKLMPELPYIGSKTSGGNENLHVYRMNSDYDLCFSIQSNEQVPGEEYHRRVSYQTTAYCGKITKGVLVNLQEEGFDGLYYRTDFTADEIQGKRQALKVAELAMTGAKNALGPFCEND